MRRAFVIGLIATFAAGSVDLGACGDKFLRLGRSVDHHEGDGQQEDEKLWVRYLQG